MAQFQTPVAESLSATEAAAKVEGPFSGPSGRNLSLIRKARQLYLAVFTLVSSFSFLLVCFNH